MPALTDLPLKDQQEVMERLFFSLQQHKRLKPIEYRSPDGEAWAILPVASRLTTLQLFLPRSIPKTDKFMTLTPASNDPLS